MFTDISHEFRTPLTMIQGPVNQLIDKEELLDKTKRIGLYKLIKNSSNQILNLINQLIDFRKTEHGKMPVKVSYNNLHHFLLEHTECFKVWAEQKNIRLKYHSDSDKMMAWFDRDLMRKIINNLISNAIKFTNEAGEIQIHVHAVDGVSSQMQIVVEDNGIGISKEVLPNIFERFYKVNNNEIGTGIGLSLVQSLVKLHHGSVICESELGVGTQFVVNFPADKEAYAESEIETSEADQKVNHDLVYVPVPIAKAPAKKKKGGEVKLLVVDDNERILDYIGQNLPYEFAVITANNGEEGINLALKENPEIIISDIMMPGKDGYTLLQELKQKTETSHIPIVLLSAKSSDDSKLMGYEKGADAYIEKPFNMDVLVSQINSLLTNRKVLKDKFRQQIKVEPEEISPTDNDALLVTELIRYVDDNMENPELKIEQLAKRVAMSSTRLNNKLKAITGYTTGGFVRVLRIKRAAQLLAETELTVGEIVSQIGFNDLKYFRVCFKKQFNCTPSEYRNSVASEVDVHN